MLNSPIIAAIAWAVILGGVGGLLTDIGSWYRDLQKPSWQPPDWLFGPAWTIILGLAAWAAVLSWNQADSAGEQTMIIWVYAANFLFHLLWSPLFFKYKRPDWALVEVVFLWLSVVAMLYITWSLEPLAGLMILPYILWVSFAAVLNAKIVQLNRPFG
ncbi:TspO/MBR family protein [Parasphingorhabdus sp.]|uniref:TspO/MBR family protein n=1 Tax=Parasphingorhabdus sp. TaxID=2709688 RepID=UPI003A9429AC